MNKQIKLDEGKVQRSGFSKGPTTPKPNIIPKGQSTMSFNHTISKKVSIGTYPLRYCNNNVSEAFTKKEIGFELEIKTENSIHREILDLESVKNLQEQIIKALVSYDEFMNRIK